MINYNPETVSTDYDMSDKLYFEELSFESVMDIYELEQPQGVILSMGGQLPNNLSMQLYDNNVNVYGTCPTSIDTAENRFKFSSLLDKIIVTQPKWEELKDLESAIEFCHKVNYPCLIRPSYVLSGAAMNVTNSDVELIEYLKIANIISKEHPVVISKFIQDANEIDVDAVASNGKIVFMAISTHLEKAGVHSGNATLITPPIDLEQKTLDGINNITNLIAFSLNINGPFNIQYIDKNNSILVIECNLRASRSFPFVSKTLGYDLITAATQIVMGLNPSEPINSTCTTNNRIGIKTSQFSFNRLPGADVRLGVQMVSTGEVACFGENKYEAYLKSLISTGFIIPKKNVFLCLGSSKKRLMNAIKTFNSIGYSLFASPGTAKFLHENNIRAEKLNRTEDDFEGVESIDYHQFTIIDYLKAKRFDMVINIPHNNAVSLTKTHDYNLRQLATELSIPLMIDPDNVELFIEALRIYNSNLPPVKKDIDIL